MKASQTRVLETQDNRTKLTLAEPVGSGGETSVFACKERPDIVIGVPHQMPPEKAERLQFLVCWHPAVETLQRYAWPHDILVDASGQVAGFTMKRADGEVLSTYLSPQTRPKSATPLFILGLFKSLAGTIHAGHASGFRIGDINDFNVIVKPDGSVVILDVLSFYFCHQQKCFGTKAGVGEMLPPELQAAFRNGGLGEEERTIHGDSWSFGVLLFKALMEGQHPFSNRELVAADEVVLSMNWPHSANSKLHPKSACPPLTDLPATLVELFRRCFENGADTPSQRPLMVDWHRVLDELIATSPAQVKRPPPVTSKSSSASPAFAPTACLIFLLAATASFLSHPSKQQSESSTVKERGVPKLWNDLRQQSIGKRGSHERRL